MSRTAARYARDPLRGRLEAIFERALCAYLRDELHGGADAIGQGILDAELVPIARRAFQEADPLPPDGEVLHVLHAQELHLLGEGYHVIALAEAGRRFVVKYAKHWQPVPPLAPMDAAAAREWGHDHGIRPDGSLHPAIWQHIRAFEAYGPLGVPSRVYIAATALESLSPAERRALERFRAIGIVRPLGDAPVSLLVQYPDDFPHEKRAEEGLEASVIVVQPLTTPLSVAIKEALCAGDVARARELEARYHEFMQQLWRCGVSHLDFSLLNIGLAGSDATAPLQIFDPHIGTIDLAEGAAQVRDPLADVPAEGRPVDTILRSSRDGSRWALWCVQQEVEAKEEVPTEARAEAATLLRSFHEASEGIERGQGSFGVERFDDLWQRRATHVVNTVMHAQLWSLVQHPVARSVRAVVEAADADRVYDRLLPVLQMDGDAPLAQFRAGLKVYDDHPLIVIVNVAEDASTLVEHWARVPLPAELDMQADAAIHYHFRDLFTGELYVRTGEALAQQGLVIGLAPQRLHVLQVEDVRVVDPVIERSLAEHRDISAFLPDCTKRVGVVGDVHGEPEALKAVLRALGFIDARERWLGRDGTLVLTGDVGHGPRLDAVFDFLRELARAAHRWGGRIVWTLGNHDLYADRDGGQGGEDSAGYRLWPQIREAALHPERAPGLLVCAVHCEHGKLFVHGGILPHIVELAWREREQAGAETVAAYVNEVFREALRARERLTAADPPHAIFRVGTSHARERRMPGEAGYDPAGVFTPDLRELDHYRYHATLLPQVVGHTASGTGEVRYAPGSWFERDYIAVDVGRQHGTGNGGLLLTDFGWVAVTPGGPARLVEVTPLFARLVSETGHEAPRAASLDDLFDSYFRTANRERRTRGDAQEDLFAELSPAQIVALERFLAQVRERGECAVVTDVDERLLAFWGGDIETGTLEALVDYLAAGGVLVLMSEAGFEWFYARLLKPLIVVLGPRIELLARALLILAGGADVFVFEDGAYRLVSRDVGRSRWEAFDALLHSSEAPAPPRVPGLDAASALYITDAHGSHPTEGVTAGRVGEVVDIGDAMLDVTDRPITSLHRGYHLTIGILVAATAALDEGGRKPPPAPSRAPAESTLWTFERAHFPLGPRLLVRVGGSGFVHAGVADADGAWHPIYEVPLVPRAEGGFEALLPCGVNVFTFFWTEPPWTEDLPGHWERDGRGLRVFRAARR